MRDNTPQINKQLVQDLARLAKLEFTEEETQDMLGDFQKIVAFVDALNQVDTEGIEPLKYVSEAQNVMRDDKAENSFSREEILQNAPDHNHVFFKVPKMMDNEQ